MSRDRTSRDLHIDSVSPLIFRENFLWHDQTTRDLLHQFSFPQNFPRTLATRNLCTKSDSPLNIAGKFIRLVGSSLPKTTVQCLLTKFKRTLLKNQAFHALLGSRRLRSQSLFFRVQGPRFLLLKISLAALFSANKSISEQPQFF